ncbi:hypothetical protein WJX72_005292 [[Myrmecia] bisecta]|uniref:DUF3119 family protein n=1 Tax=[Myrmecia] bisecta TaxID=41462 RepID=A0AAW1QQP8_9CHLO
MLALAHRPCAEYPRPAARVQTQARFGNKNTPTKQRQTVVPEPSYAIPAVLLGISAFSAYEGVTSAAVLTGILGAFLAFQATNVRFKFDDKYLEVVIGKQEKESQNAFVGGENKWAFDTFVNWEYWWPGFPVLVYFKETQTKPQGQIHFFPIIMNGKQLYDVMVERCGTSQNSRPK